MTTTHAIALALMTAASLAVGVAPAQAENCTRKGLDVTCDDGRHGIFEGNAILWPDGTHSRATPNPSVIIGNKSSVVVGQGVFTGHGKGVVPMENPSDPTRARCPVLDGLPYCY